MKTMSTASDPQQMYQALIKEINPTINAAGVEAHMRCEYSTLDHLPRETFVKEVNLAAACEREMPGYLDSIAKSYGL